MSVKANKLKNRSGKFPCEVCQNPEILVQHHINGREIHNANHSFNLVNLCSNCHMSLHSGKIVIEKWAMTDEGRKLFWHSVDDISFTGEDAKPHII